jgi:SAM-dependent methyltransferase
MSRSRLQLIVDAISFPVRAITLFDRDRCGLSSLRTERFDYVEREVLGRTLDYGCGPHNRFVAENLNENGCGVDVFQYEGLCADNILKDPTSLPFDDGSFDSVTFIANLNHIPAQMRDSELAEAWRVLRPGGNVIVTMGNPLAEILVHQVVALYDRFLGTNYDVDGERGMHADEEYYLLDSEIRERLVRAGFSRIRKRRFWTQWGLNGLHVGHKD